MTSVADKSTTFASSFEWYRPLGELTLRPGPWEPMPGEQGLWFNRDFRNWLPATFSLISLDAIYVEVADRSYAYSQTDLDQAARASNRRAVLSKRTLDRFMALKSLDDVKSFADKFGLVGLYPTVRKWCEVVSPKDGPGKDNGRTKHVLGEPAESWLYHAERLRVFRQLVSCSERLGEEAEDRIRQLVFRTGFSKYPPSPGPEAPEASDTPENLGGPEALNTPGGRVVRLTVPARSSGGKAAGTKPALASKRQMLEILAGADLSGLGDEELVGERIRQVRGDLAKVWPRYRLVHEGGDLEFDHPFFDRFFEPHDQDVRVWAADFVANCLGRSLDGHLSFRLGLGPQRKESIRPVSLLDFLYLTFVRRYCRDTKNLNYISCKECGALARVGPHAGHPKQYCSGRCQKRAERRRKRNAPGHELSTLVATKTRIDLHRTLDDLLDLRGDVIKEELLRTMESLRFPRPRARL